MKSYLTKTPKLVKELYPKYTWNIKTSIKEIFFTFDDGPHPEITLWVLETLKKFNAKATFFCVGDNIRKYPKTFREILNQGHATGNHTFNHLNGWKTSTNKYLENIEQTTELISQNLLKTNHTSRRAQNSKLNTQNLPRRQAGSKLFRPPYGKIRTKQARHLVNNNYQIVMWDVLSGDFDHSLSKEKCLTNVLQNTSNGSIIVFHDSEKAFAKLQYVLPKALRYFTEKRFHFIAL